MGTVSPARPAGLHEACRLTGAAGSAQTDFSTGPAPGRVAHRVALRGCEEIELTNGCRRQPLTPSLSRRERAIEQRNLHVDLPLNEEDALTSRADPSPPPS